MTTRDSMIFRRKERSSLEAVRPYVAEIGGAGFAAAATVLLIGVAVDHWRPGTFFSYLAPQHLVFALLAFGAMAALRDRPEPRRWAASVRFLAVGGLLALAAHAAASRYFASLAATGDRLAFAAAFATLLPFVLFRRFGEGDDGEFIES